MPRLLRFFSPKDLAEHCRESNVDVSYYNYQDVENDNEKQCILNTDDKTQITWKDDKSLVTAINSVDIKQSKKYIVLFKKDKDDDFNRKKVEKYIMGYIIDKNSKLCVGTFLPRLFATIITLIYFFGIVSVWINIAPLYSFGISVLVSTVLSAYYVIYFYRYLYTTEQKKTSLRVLEKDASDKWQLIIYRKNMLNVDELIPLLVTSLFLIFITFSFYTASLVAKSHTQIKNQSVPTKDVY